MLLAIDAGNTQTVIGLFDDSELADHWRIAIVADFGTANTIEAISEKGEYLGGAIFPGIEISMDALFAAAAALRRVELVPPKNVIGKSTMESVQSGAVYGFTGQIDALVERF